MDSRQIPMVFFIYCFGLLYTFIDEVELSVEIARGKNVTSTQPYVYNGFVFVPSLAVDGNTSNNLLCHSCLHTSDDPYITEAYFTMDFRKNYSINKVEIYYRGNYTTLTCPSTIANSKAMNYRFKGYSIHISSTSNWRNGITCYRDESNPYPDLHVNNTCIGTGSYLTIYNNNTHPAGNANMPVLELCEVKVYGCELGHFGPDCQSLCSNCKNDICDPDTGSCQSYCKDGWQGEKCDQQCGDNKYGYNCNETCGHCMEPRTCDRFIGSCSKGCAPGWTGKLCKQACNFGYYGIQCSKKCGYCANNVTCDNVNGVCIHGCRTGFRGELCLNECLDGSYGVNCFKICGNCQGRLNCRKEDGMCPDGCLSGWEGLTCLERTSDKTYVVVTMCMSIVCSVIVLSAFVVIVLCLRRRGSCSGRQNNKNNDSSENQYELSTSQRQSEHQYDQVTTSGMSK